ncbi:MAG: type II toxin-antitoxin system Phd/YefM family antitoxin [Rhodospirillaceae bacterium]|nr:type II toxin-antitoxin system Phd/YefM family antitoxin [Rhodospirillaceae bacterium]
MAGERIWQASSARAHFAEVVDLALTGTPQIVRKRSGEEVVILSRTSFELMQPNLKDYLLRSAGSANDDDDASVEAALGQVRQANALGFVPRLAPATK